ncbi:tuftelin [Vidua macroura]|uniref:tuftelin n=1 Tax=Vidua macroura TaxID=187451 RepID=UPI0023A849C6|nr:tuftelin [Vidua macroura]
MRRPTEFPEFPCPENSPGSPEDSGGGSGSAWNPEDAGPVLRLRLPRDHPRGPPAQTEAGGKELRHGGQEVGPGNSLASECVKSKDGDEEIIKVYLKARADPEEPLTPLESEGRHGHEAGSALKKLREDLSTKLQTRTEFREFGEFWEFQGSSEVGLEKRNRSCSCRGNSREKPEDPEAPQLLRRLQEAEKRHQRERSGLEGALLRSREDAERSEFRARAARGDGGGAAPEAPGGHGEGSPGSAGADGVGTGGAGAAPEGGRGESSTAGALIPAGEGGGSAPGENPSPGRHAQEPAAQSPPDDRAAAEFQERDPGQGRCDPGAEGKSFLPGSRESGDARPDRAPDREPSEPGREQRPACALQVGIRQQQTPPGPQAAAPDPSGGNLNFGIRAQPDPSPSERSEFPAGLRALPEGRGLGLPWARFQVGIWHFPPFFPQRFSSSRHPRVDSRGFFPTEFRTSHWFLFFFGFF